MSATYDAQVALMALLQAWSWPQNTPDIRWGGPTESEDLSQSGELVYFAETETDIPVESLRLGRTAFDEDMTIRVRVDVQWLGDFEQEAAARAEQLLDEIVKVFSANPTLTGTVNRLEGWTVTRLNIAIPSGWIARRTIDQAATAVVHT